MGALIACLAFAAMLALGLHPLAVDAHAYWSSNAFHPYVGTGLYGQDGYFYSPAFTQAIGPLHALPWPLFAALWTLLLTAALLWVGRMWFGYLVLVPFVTIELAMGNIHILLAAAIVAGFRWPVAWAFVLLTKVTPGVGLVWFAARREWRALGVALGATAVIALVSFAISPSSWSEWFAMLSTTNGTQAFQPLPVGLIPLPARVLIAAGLVAWGARTDRRWVVPVAATLALPVIYINGLAMLVAVPYLLKTRSAPDQQPDWPAVQDVRRPVPFRSP